MSIDKLFIQDFRNIASVSVDLNQDLNFIIGDNGSGKSSLLEAIFYLGHGKSFRSSKADNLLMHNKLSFTVSAKTQSGAQLGVRKGFFEHLNLSEIRVSGEKQTKFSALAKNIAVQVITPESFKLFFGGPKQRRRFIDLGLFHVKHGFSDHWREFTRIHKQRNACLRTKTDLASLNYWSDVFATSSEQIAQYRAAYVEQLTKELSFWLKIMLPKVSDDIVIQYLQGWNSKRTLLEVLSQYRDKELAAGYSLYGAQKFDVRFVLNGTSLDNQLSRGQQKLFLLALTFAQAQLIAREKRVKPILLIDDVGAELDIHSRALLNNAIAEITCQVVVTAIDKTAVAQLVPKEDNYKMFHVKHGKLSVISE
ncbi:DNA replication and repair protein RecF [Colwellia chukchiensis]|uniref:DNA replication and repair protein RecF n=1 Tax=Colwellia chukchiensis TaxID=641665 RepID=A0A1H7PH76_9GAMM|nr:DNA replication/repair protein RecF [Colwellia chukchiensis]SEL35130.1 DNA replication and repair protein RecF [Colwellia chukchiensis]